MRRSRESDSKSSRKRNFRTIAQVFFDENWFLHHPVTSHSLFGPALLSRSPQLISQTKIQTHSSCNKWSCRFHFLCAFLLETEGKKSKNLGLEQWREVLRAFEVRQKFLSPSIDCCCYRSSDTKKNTKNIDQSATKSFIDFRWKLMCCGGKERRTVSMWKRERYQSHERECEMDLFSSWAKGKRKKLTVSFNATCWNEPFQCLMLSNIC